MAERKNQRPQSKAKSSKTAGTDTSDTRKTKAELLDEVGKLKRKVARLESAGKKLAAHERLLEESEQRYREVVAASPIGITIYNASGQCVAANESVAEIIGANREQVLSQNFHEIESWKRSGLYNAAVKALKTGQPRKVDTELFVTSFGKKVYLSCYQVPFPPDGLLFMVEDHTARRSAEESLKRKTEKLKTAVMEKEILLSEVHHRVKNNLAIVSSILQMQSRYIEDREFRDIFTECQNRIRAMALVHDQLYNSNNLADMDLGKYVRSLTEMLSGSFQQEGSGISIKSKVSRIELNTEQMISVGMIITEAVTNSLMHAFPGGGPGNVLVSIKSSGDKIKLRISDDGTGFKPSDAKPDSFGLKLLQIFSGQLDGSLELRDRGGTEITVVFRNRVK